MTILLCVLAYVLFIFLSLYLGIYLKRSVSNFPFTKDTIIMLSILWPLGLMIYLWLLAAYMLMLIFDLSIKIFMPIFAFFENFQERKSCSKKSNENS